MLAIPTQMAPLLPSDQGMLRGTVLAAGKYQDYILLGL